MMLDSSLIGFNFKDQFSWYLWVNIEYLTNDSKFFLPNQDEANQLNHIEDYLMSNFKSLSPTLFIGRKTLLLLLKQLILKEN